MQDCGSNGQGWGMVVVESECPDSNRGPLAPEASALPAEPHSVDSRSDTIIS